MRGSIYLNSLTHFLFPRECVICKRELFEGEKYICLSCYAEIPFTYFWTYTDHEAEVSFWGKAQISRVISLFFYTDNYNKLLYSIKYHSNTGLCKLLGKMLGEKIAFSAKHDHFNPEYIIPVPLHYFKKWKRGYNQSEIIAREIASINNCTIVELLKRVKFTKTQTHKNKIERWNSVEHAFAIKKKNFLLKIIAPKTCRIIEKLMRSKRETQIILVDDVLTTGATLEACTNILQREIKCKIIAATLAYVE